MGQNLKLFADEYMYAWSKYFNLYFLYYVRLVWGRVYTYMGQSGICLSKVGETYTYTYSLVSFFHTACTSDVEGLPL